MKDIFTFLVYLGLSKNDSSLESRAAKLCNQINVFIATIMLIVLIFLRVMGQIEGEPMGMGSFRIFLVFLLSVSSLLLAALRYHLISAIFTIFLPSFFFVIFPTLFGFVEAESFTYYGLVIIGFSIVPQLLIIPERRKTLFGISMLYFFLLIIFFDRFLILFLTEPIPLVDNINSFYPYYKAGHIFVFIFIHLSLLYLRQLNTSYENDLKITNSSLQVTAKELSRINTDLNTSQLVLETKNSELLSIQENLNNKNRELQNTLSKLKSAQQTLIQSEKLAALGTLIAGVAHEINNPLNFITGGIGIIDLELESYKLHKANRLSEQQIISLFKTIQGASEMINAGVDKATEIVNTLKVYTYNGGTVLIPEDLNKVIDSALVFLKSKIGNNIKLEKTYFLDKPVPLHQGKIHQIFLNLFDNAIHAVKESAPDRHIYITTSLEIRNNREFAKVSIVNTGPQIPDDVLKNIFDPFYTTKKTGEGTGLGLSISRELVREHNGDLQIINVPVGVGYILLIPTAE